RIRIAFNPLAETFEVTDASILKDKAYISDISALWAQDVVVHRFSTAFLADYPRQLDEREKDRVLDAISRLHALTSYAFTALTLNASVKPEEVAEVFVRINGEGKKLNQSDFIMTLMSVFWDKGRAELEAFAQNA